MTYFRMYVNIMNKYGKNSKQMEKYRNYLKLYIEKPHIMKRIYDIIMKSKK